jgi:hypothetical protein
LGPFGSAATNWPIVPAQGDYDDGEIGDMIGRRNLSTRRKLLSDGLRAMLGGSLVTTAWRVLRSRIKATTSRYGG